MNTENYFLVIPQFYDTIKCAMSVLDVLGTFNCVTKQ